MIMRSAERGASIPWKARIPGGDAGQGAFVFTDALKVGWVLQTAFIVGYFELAVEDGKTQPLTPPKRWQLSEEALKQHETDGFRRGVAARPPTSSPNLAEAGDSRSLRSDPDGTSQAYLDERRIPDGAEQAARRGDRVASVDRGGLRRVRRALCRARIVPQDYIFERIGAHQRPEHVKLSELFEGKPSLIL